MTMIPAWDGKVQKTFLVDDDISPDGFALCHCDNPVFEVGYAGNDDNNFKNCEKVLICKNCRGFLKIKEEVSNGSVISKCEFCGREFENSFKGFNKKRYCSANCRTRASTARYFKRHRAEKLASGKMWRESNPKKQRRSMIISYLRALPPDERKQILEEFS